jgi:hypothetical protein
MKAQAWLVSRYYIRLGKPRKGTTTCQDSRSPYRDSKRVPHQYKCGALPLHYAAWWSAKNLGCMPSYGSVFGLFNDISNCIRYVAWWTGKGVGGSGRCLFRETVKNSFGGAEANHGIPNVRLTRILSEVRSNPAPLECEARVVATCPRCSAS